MMKKKIVALLLSAAMCTSAVAGLAACDGTTTGEVDLDDPNNAAGGTFDISVWCSEVKGDGWSMVDLTKSQIQKFNETNGKYTFNVNIEPVPESEAATQVITDVASAPDLYFFAQDQFARLVQAGALQRCGVKASEEVRANNDAGAVAAVTSGEYIYAYPATSDNGYFMYYDKSVITDPTHLDSLEQLIADCEGAGKNFSMELDTSGWYNVAFFFAAEEPGKPLCSTRWVTDDDGNFTGVNDTFNTDNGVIALKGMQKLLKSKSHVSSSKGTDFDAGTPSAVVVSGAWDVNNVKKALGANFGVTDLPSFTVDGKSYHMGSFSGNKLIGVKPQNDVNKAAGLQLLARYLSNEECQLQRFETAGWGPSNNKAKENDAVKSDDTLTALATQNNYATPEGPAPGTWWDATKVYATAAKKAINMEDFTDEKNDAALRKALADYEKTIKGVYQMSEEEKNAFTVIGNIAGDTNWTIDRKMIEDPKGTWITEEAFDMTTETEFKVRQGKDWKVQFGGGKNEAGEVINYKVTTAGKYKIKLVYNATDGTGEITLVPAA